MLKKSPLAMIGFFLVMLFLGSVTLNVNATDIGEEQTSSFRNINPPTCNITYPVNNSVVGGTVIITGTAWDSNQVLVVEVNLTYHNTAATDTSGNGSWATWQYAWNTSSYNDGWHIINASAWNGTQDSERASVTVYVNNTPPPNQPPGVSVNDPNDQDSVSGIVAINGTAWDDQAVTIVEVQIDDSNYPATDTSGNGSWFTWEHEWNTSGVTDGWHYINATSSDGTLVSVPVSLQVFVNNTVPPDIAPVVNITYPSDNMVLNGTVIITGVAWDDIGVQDVEVKLDSGQSNLATDTSGNGTWFTWQFIWNTTQYSNEQHTIAAEAYDGTLGSIPDDVNVTVNNTSQIVNQPPGISITNPSNASEVNGTVVITGSAWDDVGVLHVEIRIDGGPYHLATDTSGNGTWFTWQYIWDTTNFTNGLHTLLATCWDGQYGAQPAADAHVTVSNVQLNTCPTINITYPTQNLELEGLINITGTASDDASVTQVNVIINGTWYNATDSSGNGSWASWFYNLQTGILPDGPLRIIAAAFDGTCWDDDSVWIGVNNTPPNTLPQIQITSPQDNQDVSGILNISGTASDDVGVLLVKVLINGTDHDATDVSGSGIWTTWFFLFDTTTLPNGQWQITVSAFDGASWEDANVWVNIDNPIEHETSDGEEEEDEEEVSDEEDEGETIAGDRTPIMVAAVATMVLAASFGAATQGGRYRLFAFLFPLFTKLKKEEVLDNFIRGQLYGYIIANPGDHYASIKQHLGLQNGTCAYHLRVLERENFIKSTWDGLNKRFYPFEMSIPKVEKEPFTEVALSSTQKQIVDMIRSDPGITQAQIAKKIGSSKQVVSYHISMMSKAMIIKIERNGNRNECYVDDLYPVREGDLAEPGPGD